MRKLKLRFLRRSEFNPSGWVVQGYSWFIDQTIGGAVATGTHGSSLANGSLSSQVLGIEVVLANGTIAHFTKWSHPHHFKALQVKLILLTTNKTTNDNDNSRVCSTYCKTSGIRKILAWNCVNEQ
eukprot:scaffold57745_cov38-Prasinocladus_malaysianus.AAC.2